MDECQVENLDRLLVALRVSDPKVFCVKAMEALGMLTLMVHWLRGMFNILEHYHAVALPPEAWDSFHTLRDSLEAYEALLWRIAPPRAMTQQIGVWRESGYLDEEFEKLLISDSWGRASDLPQTDEIRDVIGRMIGQDRRTTPEEEWEQYGNRP